jgi:hypothetical protein
MAAAANELHELSVETVEIRLRRLPPAFDGFRIVQLSDIHFSRYMTKERLEHAVAVANAQRPDLAVLTGDYVTEAAWSMREARAWDAWPCAAITRGLQARFGRVAVLGNHDRHTSPQVVTESLAQNGHRVLRDQSFPLELDGARLWVAGMELARWRQFFPEVALQGIPAGECVIAAVHEPDTALRTRRYPVDLQLSGHSHGGQIRLPGIGPLYLPEGARRFPAGLYRLGDLQLYTNRGLGVIEVPLRFCCPPELTVFTLRSAPQSG